MMGLFWSLDQRSERCRNGRRPGLWVAVGPVLSYGAA